MVPCRAVVMLPHMHCTPSGLGVWRWVMWKCARRTRRQGCGRLCSRWRQVTSGCSSPNIWNLNVCWHVCFQRESSNCFVGQNSATMGPETRAKHREQTRQYSTPHTYTITGGRDFGWNVQVCQLIVITNIALCRVCWHATVTYIHTQCCIHVHTVWKNTCRRQVQFKDKLGSHLCGSEELAKYS